MNKFKIKNLVIRNIYSVISALLVTSIIPITSSIAKKSNIEEKELSMTQSVLTSYNHGIEYMTNSSFYYRQKYENRQRRKVVLANLPKNLDIDYMILEAKEQKEKEELEEKEKFINNLIEAYEIGYNSETDTEVNSDAFTISTDNQTYEYLTDKEFEFFAAVVAAECNDSFDDALATASSVVNRCDSERWSSWVDGMGKDGTNPIDHITTEGQYEVYASGAYKDHLNGNIPEDVLKACKLVLFDGIRSHNYCSFRSKDNKSYGEAVVDGGNNYADEIENVKKKEY